MRTIDSVCAEIARALPVTSGGATGLTPVKDPEPLYREAARRTLLELGGEDAALNEALRTLLLHRDGSVANCESLLAEMLGSRDQWGELVPFRGEQISDEVLDGTVRPRLDRALELAVCRGMTRLGKAIPPDVLRQMSLFGAEMADLPPYRPGDHPFAICRNLREAPEDTIEDLEHWTALVHLLITTQGEWRAVLQQEPRPGRDGEASPRGVEDLCRRIAGGTGAVGGVAGVPGAAAAAISG